MARTISHPPPPKVKACLQTLFSGSLGLFSNVKCLGAVGSAEGEVSRLLYLDLCQADSEGPAVMVCSAEMPPEARPSGQIIDTSLESKEKGSEHQTTLHLDQSPKDGPAAILGWTSEAWTHLSGAIHSATVWTADPITHGLLETAGAASPFQVPLIFSGSTGPVDSHLRR